MHLNGITAIPIQTDTRSPNDYGESRRRCDQKRQKFVVGDRTLVGKEIGLSLKKLFPNDELHEGKNTIQLSKYFVAGDHDYSLDSRYNLLGLVDKKDVIGRAYPIF